MRTVPPLLTRLAVLLAMFVVYSGVIGSRIVSHGLVSRDGFQIYGGAGKALLFGFLCLSILAYRKSAHVELTPWRTANPFWVLALLLMGMSWYSVDRLIAGVPGLTWPVLAHVGLLSTIAFAAIGMFGLANIRLLAAKYQHEAALSVCLAIGFYGFLSVVYRFWGVLAAAVVDSVSFLLRLSGLSVTVVQQRTLLLDRFGINIAKYCSGIESIALFSGLYVLVGILDWRRLNHVRFTAVFLPALVVLFAFNILRVFGLILGGYYISQEIAFSLFHTYAGMVFFIIYCAVFWRVSYGWLAKKTADDATC